MTLNLPSVGIRTKAILPFIVFMILVSLTIQGVWIPAHKEHEKEYFLEAQSQKLAIVNLVIADLRERGSLSAIDAFLTQTLELNPDWTMIELYDNNNRLLYPPTDSFSEFLQLHNIELPVIANGKKYGKTQIHIDLKSFGKKEESNSDYAIYVVALFIVLCAGLALWILEKYIIKPLKRLQKSIVALSDGSYDDSIDAKGNDEISYLARAFNEMRIHLFKALQELAHQAKHAQLAEETTKKAEQNLRAILNNIADGILTVDEEGIINSANIAILKMAGYEATELIGQNINVLIPRDARVRHERLIQSLNSSGRTMRLKPIEVELLTKEGNKTNIELRVTTITQFNRNTYIAVIRDIEQQRAAAISLRQERDRAQRYLDTASVMLLSLDRAGQITMINRKGCEILGYTEAQILNQNWFDIVVPDDLRDEMREFHLSVMKGSSTLVDVYEMSVLTSKREKLVLACHANITQNDDGEVIGILLSGQDVTTDKRLAKERRLMQQQLIQSQKMQAIGQLTGGIAHDFNNMLAGILGFAELALENPASKSDQSLHRYLQEIHTSGERARNLVAKMLAFSRQRHIEKPGSLLLAPTINDMTKMLRSVIPSTITFDFDLPVNIPPVMLDTIELQQLITNLCINARDAMGGTGTLSVKIMPLYANNYICRSCHENFSGEYAAITVTDTGSGMSTETMQHLFEPFFTTKEVGKGTGMGLGIVHGIVHDRGGHILVNSTLGKGTSFTLLLPFATDSFEQLKEAI